MVYALHHLCGLLGAVLTGAALVYGRTWTRSLPMLAVGLWHLLLLTAGLSLFGLLVSIALHTLRLGVAPALGAVGRDLRRLTDLTTIEGLALFGAVLLIVLTLGAYAASTRQRRRVQARHSSLLGILAEGRYGPVTVIDHTAMLVYALPGREPRIVATTAAINGLDGPGLRAVLAHERHHLSARHDLARLPFAMLRRALPGTRIPAALSDEIELLLEMCADDHAARSGHGEGLRAAMHVFAQGAGASLRTPVPGCTAATALAARCRRLGVPASRPQLVMALAGYASVLTFAATTLSLYVLPA